jgi:hypothetical protein
MKSHIYDDTKENINKIIKIPWKDEIIDSVDIRIMLFDMIFI